MNLKFKIALVFFFLHSFGQAQSSSVEVQAVIGLTTLQTIGARGAPGYYIDSDLIKEDIKQLDYIGFDFELGLLSTRHLNKSFHIRSGLQFHYLQSKINYLTETTDKRFPDIGLEDRHLTTTTTIRGFQIPVLLGYRKSFEKWSAFAELGFSLSHAPVKIKRAYNLITYYDYGNVYIDSCECFTFIDPQLKPTPLRDRYDNKDKLKNFEARAIFAIGALINQQEGRTLRLAYRISGSLHPLENGNRDNYRLYGPYEVYKSGSKHLIHQLEFSWGWPTRKSLLSADGKTIVTQKGIFVGAGISLFQPYQRGTGWGRNAHLAYVSPWGFGARVEVARLVAPSSYYGITARFYKLQALYQMDNGIQFHGGWSTGTGVDGDGSGYKGGGFHVGAGAVIQLNRFLGLQFQLSEHYFYQEFGSDYMLEGGVGLLFHVWK